MAAFQVTTEADSARAISSEDVISFDSQLFQNAAAEVLPAILSNYLGSKKLSI